MAKPKNSPQTPTAEHQTRTPAETPAKPNAAREKTVPDPANAGPRTSPETFATPGPTAEPEPCGTTLTLRQERAVVALLACSSITESARQAGISERSIYRWLTNPDFQLHLRQARRQAVSRAMGRLQQVAERAVETLDELMHDGKVNPSSRVSAARTALRFACQAVEIDEFEERLAALEQARQTLEQEKAS